MAEKNIKKPKKTFDERIERLEEQLKKAKEDKKESIQKKGRNLWRKINHIFLDDEKNIDILNEDKEKLNILINDIEESLKKIFNNKLEKKGEANEK